jgi:aspartate/methionine/tyrosine aminotransferase
MMAEYTLRRDLMRQTFDALGVTYALPQGAFYFFANISGAGLDSLSFCKRAVTAYGLLFFPGSMFGDEAEGYIRISFLAPRPQLEVALRRFSELYEECRSAR